MQVKLISVKPNTSIRPSWAEKGKKDKFVQQLLSAKPWKFEDKK